MGRLMHLYEKVKRISFENVQGDKTFLGTKLGKGDDIIDIIYKKYQMLIT